jgi:hypothetical protein
MAAGIQGQMTYRGGIRLEPGAFDKVHAAFLIKKPPTRDLADRARKFESRTSLCEMWENHGSRHTQS